MNKNAKSNLKQKKNEAIINMLKDSLATRKKYELSKQELLDIVSILYNSID